MWAQEDSRQLRELKERLGVVARQEPGIESGLTNGTSPGREASPLSRSREPNQTFAVGSRVRVIRGRHFRDFGAGDSGLVLQTDREGSTCTVAFDRGGEPLQVAARHLEFDFRRNQRSAAQVSRAGSRERYLENSKQSEPIALSTSTALERARRAIADSTSGCRAASMPPQFGVSLNLLALSPEQPNDVLWSEDALRVNSSLRSTARNPQVAAFTRSLDVQSPREGTGPTALERVYPVEDALRLQAAELRRTAEAAAAAELASLNTTSQLEAQALAEAVQASATATATATANAASEVSSLRLSVSEMQSLIRGEAEQRVASFRAIERDIAQLQAQHQHHYMETEDSLKAEQKRLARKQAELVSLCLSLQEKQAEDPKIQLCESSIISLRDEVKLTVDRVAVADQRAESIAESLRNYDTRLSALEGKVKLTAGHATALDQRESIDNLLQRSATRMLTLENQVSDLMNLSPTIDRISSRISAMEPNVRSRSEQLDSLSARIDTLMNDLMSETSKYQEGIAELRRSGESMSERLLAFSSRVDTLGGSGLEFSSRLDPDRLDTLSSRVDMLVSSLAGKFVDREGLSSAISTRVDDLMLRVDEKLSRESLRLEEMQTKSLQEAVTSLELSCSEQLQRFSDEAARRVSQLKEAASQAEAKASQVLVALAEPSSSTRPEALIGIDTIGNGRAGLNMTPTTSKTEWQPNLFRSPSMPGGRETSSTFVSPGGYPSMMQLPSPSPVQSQQSFGSSSRRRSFTPPPNGTEPLARWAAGAPLGARSASTSVLNPSQANIPVGVVGIDTTGNGRANVFVSGADRNLNGLPDVLEGSTPPRTTGAYSNNVPRGQTPTAWMPNCSVCGADFVADSLFCRQCGKKRGEEFSLAALGAVYGARPSIGFYGSATTR